MRQIILYPGEDGYWVVECISQGKTKEEAIANIREAIELYTYGSLVLSPSWREFILK